MPAQKKIWIFDGHVEQYQSALTSGSVHQGKSCVDCHGGNATASDRTAAHAGFQPIPGAEACGTCHADTAAQATSGLHTTLSGYEAILAQRGFDFADESSKSRYDKQCTKCHIANSEGKSACGECHVSVPGTAGGGLLQGHRLWRTPSMDNNCTACHGSRVKDEYYGQNNELAKRNNVGVAELAPDVHKQQGMTCVACHPADEMHGSGAPSGRLAGQDRYHVTTAPRCADCHGPGKTDATSFSAVGLHTDTHLNAMACQVCHAQPYKNCFGCHTDVTAGGTGFYVINEGDPTWAARKAASATAAPDALMTFRAGKAGRTDKYYAAPAKPYKYAALRHVPVDRDTFTYTGANSASGFLPGMTNLPIWKYATPHTIAKETPITSSCGNCHGDGYTGFWLTDPLGDAEGWVGTDAGYQADEIQANGPALVPAKIPYTEY